MIEICLTVEGQRGLTWPRWQRLVPAVEELGFAGLFRSDHFYDADPPNQDSLELWTSLTWLAANTKRMSFGTLVTPVSFRHPVHIARTAKDIDDLSGGRMVLGVGAGWGGGVREHEAFGFDILETKERFVRWQEGLEVIKKLLQNDEPVTYTGQYYRLNEATLLPRPQRLSGPTIMIGGNGPDSIRPNKMLEMAARYGDEWNGIYRTPAQFTALSAYLDELLDQNNRPRTAVRRSQMKGLIFGRTDAELANKLDGHSVDELWNRGLVVGTPAQIVDQLGQLADVGVQRVMLQWADVDDLDGLEAFADAVVYNKPR
ncbi:LLM class flavin-dependent oxidoreductase [Chloroflexi bacterium TSY]|nr:LLM class flavin-dependent oxidoreductase [Chloroflexi bacterium TSY]